MLRAAATWAYKWTKEIIAGKVWEFFSIRSMNVAVNPEKLVPVTDKEGITS